MDLKLQSLFKKENRGFVDVSAYFSPVQDLVDITSTALLLKMLLG